MPIFLAANTHPWLVVAGIIVAIVIVLLLIERLFSWLGNNASRYMRDDSKVKGGMRNVMGTMEEFIHPELRHVHEEQEQRQAESGQTDPSDR
jgi:hypothetical protein